MAVSIQANFNSADIRKAIADRMAQIEKAVLMRLQRVGETFVTNARTNGAYTDRTGNLRSSIGYVILKNGQQHTSGGFETVTVNGKAGRKGGSATGKKVINEVAQNFPTGFVLIVVAGMDYAAAVESKGKDVLTGSSQIATSELKAAMQAISKKIDRL